MTLDQSLLVLDHGYVKYIQHCGTDQTVIETARMSTGKGFKGWEEDLGLLEFLYENDHATPFESGDLMIEVQCPIFVVRQWHRHRTQSYNELSGRYTEMPNLFYVPRPDRIKKKSKSNKQGSGTPFSVEEQEIWSGRLQEEQLEARDYYEEHVDSGMADELARINLPLSQYTRFRAKANLRNWLHFLGLRLHEHAQEEIRMFAKAVADIIQELWPKTYELFLEHTLYATKFSRSEMAFLMEHYLPSQEDMNDFKERAEQSLGTKRAKKLAGKMKLSWETDAFPA